MGDLVKLGDVAFSVVDSENPVDSVSVTDNAVEDGQDVSDHVKQEPSIINVQGHMTGDDAAEKLAALKKSQKDGELLRYVGRNGYGNMVIESLDRQHGVDNKFGFGFNLTLKQVRIATAKEAEIDAGDPVTKSKTGKVKAKTKTPTNKGRQQPKAKQVAEIRKPKVSPQTNRPPSPPGATPSGPRQSLAEISRLHA